MHESQTIELAVHNRNESTELVVQGSDIMKGICEAVPPPCIQFCESFYITVPHLFYHGCVEVTQEDFYDQGFILIGLKLMEIWRGQSRTVFLLHFFEGSRVLFCIWILG